MNRRNRRRPPRWLYAIISGGALFAAGIYLGMMRVSGPEPAYNIRLIAFAALGIVMLYAAMSSK